MSYAFSIVSPWGEFDDQAIVVLAAATIFAG
jgi:hypothetical protein